MLRELGVLGNVTFAASEQTPNGRRGMVANSFNSFLPRHRAFHAQTLLSWQSSSASGLTVLQRVGARPGCPA